MSASVICLTPIQYLLLIYQYCQHKDKVPLVFFVQDDQSDSDCCSLSHSGELRGHFSSSHSDASARNAPQKTAFLRFTEICLCLMQFKAVQSNNPSLGALTLGHKRHHNNNTNGTERRQLSTPVPTGSLPIANMDEQKYGSRWDVNMDAITALIMVETQ